MATIEEAEDLEKRISIEAGRGGMRVVARLTESTAGSLQTTLAGVLRSVMGEQGGATKKPGELASVKDFGAKIRGADRDVVDIGSKRVLEEVRRELRRSGVDFAVEKTKDGQVLHFRSSDAKVLAAALERASDRVDARTADAAAKRDIAEKISARVNGSDSGELARERSLSEEREVSKDGPKVTRVDEESPVLDSGNPALEGAGKDAKIATPPLEGPDLSGGRSR